MSDPSDVDADGTEPQTAAGADDEEPATTADGDARTDADAVEREADAAEETPEEADGTASESTGPQVPGGAEVTVDRGVRTFDRNAPSHLLAVGLATASLVSGYGLAGGVAAFLVVVTWARAGPFYAVVVGSIGVFGAGAVEAALGESVPALRAPVSLAAGSRLALLIHAAVAMALLTIPLVAFLGPDSRRTLAAGAVAAVPVGGVAGAAVLTTGAYWIGAAAGLATGLLCAAAVHRYQVVGLRHAIGRGETHG